MKTSLTMNYTILSKICLLRGEIVDFNLNRGLIGLMRWGLESYMIRALDMRAIKVLRRWVLRKAFHGWMLVYCAGTMLLWRYKWVRYLMVSMRVILDEIDLIYVACKLIGSKCGIACRFILLKPPSPYVLDFPNGSGLSLLQSWVVSALILYERNGKSRKIIVVIYNDKLLWNDLFFQCSHWCSEVVVIDLRMLSYGLFDLFLWAFD